jgi:hypothetical protein
MQMTPAGGGSSSSSNSSNQQQQQQHSSHSGDIRSVLPLVQQHGLASLCTSAFDSCTLAMLAVQTARSEQLLQTGCFLLQAVAVVRHWHLITTTTTTVSQLGEDDTVLQRSQRDRLVEAHGQKRENKARAAARDPIPEQSNMSQMV